MKYWRQCAPLLMLALTGCPDPQGAFDDFVDRYHLDAAGTGGAEGDGGVCDLPDPSQLEGKFVLVVSPSFQPKTPIVLLDDVSAVAAGSDRLNVGMTLTALSATDRTTPVGAPLAPVSAELGAGSFTFDFGQIQIVGEADPFLPGEIVSTLTLSGELCAPPVSTKIDFLCGNAAGQVTKPLAIGLAGSTWTLARVASNGELPALTLNCAKDPPDAP